MVESSCRLTGVKECLSGFIYAIGKTSAVHWWCCICYHIARPLIPGIGTEREDLVSILARHITSPSSREPSGTRHDDPGLGACDAQRQELAYGQSE